MSIFAGKDDANRVMLSGDIAAAIKVAMAIRGESS
jgi:hypothetical protein